MNCSICNSNKFVNINRNIQSNNGYEKIIIQYCKKCGYVYKEISYLKQNENNIKSCKNR